MAVDQFVSEPVWLVGGYGATLEPVADDESIVVKVDFGSWGKLKGRQSGRDGQEGGRWKARERQPGEGGDDRRDSVKPGAEEKSCLFVGRVGSPAKACP